MFLNNAIHEKIEQDGFYIGGLLNPQQIEQLLQSFQQLKQKVGHSLGKDFWPSGRYPDPEIRNFAKDAIESLVPTALEQYIDKEKTRLIGGTFLIKPPSRKSALSPHQDSSHVDERNDFSVYAWIPLQNVNKWNGCFHYLPGSHTWGIHQRSLNVEWPLKDKIKELSKMMQPIKMKKGEVLFFHSALIHSSPPNYSFRTRVAINYYLHPKSSPFLHFFEDEQTPKDKVEMFEVTPAYYYDEDFEKRPNDKYPLIEILPKSKIKKEIISRL